MCLLLIQQHKFLSNKRILLHMGEKQNLGEVGERNENPTQNFILLT